MPKSPAPTLQLLFHKSEQPLLVGTEWQQILSKSSWKHAGEL
jgi:hypothetical protein